MCSSAGEALTGISTCIGNETKKLGDAFELGLAVPGADSVHEGEHRRGKDASAHRPLGATVGPGPLTGRRVPFTDDPLALFQSIENPRHGRWMQPSA